MNKGFLVSIFYLVEMAGVEPASRSRLPFGSLQFSLPYYQVATDRQDAAWFI